MSRKIITTDQAPAAGGPYSQGVLVDGWLWPCGQVALDPATGRQSNALRKALQKRFRYAFVDEFQDTDPVQWEILQRIFLAEDHRLLVIGDPKQAIYGFRGADLDTYRRATAALRRQRLPPLPAGSLGPWQAQASAAEPSARRALRAQAASLPHRPTKA